MNPVALITGASRGIGKGIALRLAALGYDLALNYAQDESAACRTAEEARLAAKACGHDIRAEPARADLASRHEREALLTFVRQEFTTLDVLVNNAGVAPATRADLLETDEESFDRLLAVNLKAPFFLSQRVAQWMIEQRRSPAASQIRPPPKILFVSSISAYTASVNRGEYCVSKAGVSMLTRLFASRLADDGIQVFEIRPGIISTDMTSTVREKYDRLISEGLTPIRRWGTPDDVGRAVAAIVQDLFPFSTGEVLNVDGGFHLRRL